MKKEGLITNQLREMKIKKFLKEYHFEDWYLSNIAPAEMMKDLVVMLFSIFVIIHNFLSINEQTCHSKVVADLFSKHLMVDD